MWCEMRIKQQTVQVSVLNCINVYRNKYSAKYKTVLKALLQSVQHSHISLWCVCVPLSETHTHTHTHTSKPPARWSLNKTATTPRNHGTTSALLNPMTSVHNSYCMNTYSHNGKQFYKRGIRHSRLPFGPTNLLSYSFKQNTYRAYIWHSCFHFRSVWQYFSWVKQLKDALKV